MESTLFRAHKTLIKLNDDDNAIGHGGFGKVFLGEVVNSEDENIRVGTKVVVKTPNIDMSRSVEDIMERLSDIMKATAREFSVKSRLEMINEGVAHVLDFGAYPATIKDDIPVFVVFLVQEYIEGEDLPDYCITHYPENEEGNFKGIADSERWFAMAANISRVVGQVHGQRIIHGDIWRDNIRVQPDGKCVLIDFGQSWFVNFTFDKYNVDAKSHAYMAPERRPESSQAWNFPADFYSVGGILYFLATGEDPPLELCERNDELKEFLVERIQSVNPALYNSNPGVVDVIHRCLRYSIHDRASHAEEVLSDIYAYSPRDKSIDTSSLFGVNTLFNNLQLSISALKPTTSPLFYELISRELENIVRRIETVNDGLYTISGDRQTYVNVALSILSALDEGDQYLALTTPAFWSDMNFGVRGRVLTANLMAAKRGVKIRRVLLVGEDTSEKEATKNILRAQKRAMTELEQIGINTKDTSIDGEGYYTGYCILPETELDTLVRRASTFIMVRKNGICTLFAPTYKERGGELAVVRFWDNPARREEFRQMLEKFLPLSQPVSEYDF